MEDKVHANDLHAAMLTLLGLDHKKLNIQISGLDKRLTGVGSDGEYGVEVAKRLLQS